MYLYDVCLRYRKLIDNGACCQIFSKNYWNMLDYFARIFSRKKMFYLCFRFNFWFVRYLPRIIFLLQEIPLECTTINIYQYLTKYSSHRSSFFLVRVFFFCNSHSNTILWFFSLCDCEKARYFSRSNSSLVLVFFVMTLFFVPILYCAILYSFFLCLKHFYAFCQRNFDITFGNFCALSKVALFSW